MLFSRELLAEQQVASDGIIVATVNKATSCRTEDVMNAAQQLKQQGLEQGREEERYEMAKNLLAEGLSLELVKKVTKLPDLVLTELEDA